MNKREQLEQDFDEIIVADGFDDCILGYVWSFDGFHALYDYHKIIDRLVERDGMTIEEAQEFFEYNIVGYGGEGLPVYGVLYDKERA